MRFYVYCMYQAIIYILIFLLMLLIYFFPCDFFSHYDGIGITKPVPFLGGRISSSVINLETRGYKICNICFLFCQLLKFPDANACFYENFVFFSLPK